MQFSSKYLPIATVLIQLDKHDYDGWWNRPLQSPPGVIVVTCATVWSRANSCAVQVRFRVRLNTENIEM